nr:PREDICTED: Krueppel-like factor 17 [Bemisia tabaci]
MCCLMASEIKLFRPWTAYSYDLLQPPKCQKSNNFQTDLLIESPQMTSGNITTTDTKERQMFDSKPSVASPSSVFDEKRQTWCSLKREFLERRCSVPNISKNLDHEADELNHKVTLAGQVSNEMNAMSTDSRTCDNRFNVSLDFFHVEPQSLDPLRTKSLPSFSSNYFNYPNCYDPSLIAYGLSPEDVFGVQNELLHSHSTDAWSNLAELYSQANQKKVKQRPKKFQCPQCNVAFSNNGQLKGHVRIHTGERPFKCDVDGCGKSFTRNEELTRHKRIHSGLRPFSCVHCGKKFGRKDHLKKHVRTHLPQPRFAAELVHLYPFLYGY